MAFYQKKPLIVEALEIPYKEYGEVNWVWDEVPQWLTDAYNDKTIDEVFRTEDYWYLIVRTLEGEMQGSPGDYLIRGIHGELYVCDSEIFKETYTAIKNIFVELGEE